MSIKISELPLGSALSGTEEIPIVQSANTKKITAQDIADLASGGSGDMTKAVYDPNDTGIVLTASKEMVAVINKTGATITKGSIVYLKSSSSSSAYPEILLADADTEATSSKTLGATYTNILNDAVGYVVTSGEVDNLDTTAYNIGDKLWLSQTAGQVTTTPPTQPAHSVFIGTVTRSQNTNGRVLYAIQNGYELGELHNVLLTSPANNNALVYETSSLLWKNKALTTAEVADSTNKRYVTDAQKTNFTNPKITVECIDALTVDFYAMYSFQIDSVTAITNSPTTTILVNDSAYTFEVSIATGAKITVTLNTAGVVNLNTTRL